MSRLRSARDRADRAEASRRVVVGDHEQEPGDRDADQGAEPEVGNADAGPDERVFHHPLGDRVEERCRDHTGENHAAVERALDPVGRRADDERSGDRREDRDAAQDERVDRDLAGEALREGEDAEEHHGDRGHGVSLEEVRRHAGAVADVVADVVGDHRGVARVVLGDACFDLADEVGADVGRLGEDAAAESGEDRDERTTEAEADERVNGLLVALAGEDEDPEVARHAEERKPHDEHAGHRAALEGDVESRRNAAASRLGDAGVGADREVHADESRRAGEHATDHEADRDRDALDRDQHEHERNRDDGDDRVLAVQVGLGPFLDGPGDLLHAVVAGRERE